MNRFILIAAFFGFLLATELVVTALAAEAFGICMMDSVADGEAENDSKEKSEEVNKIEILLACSFEVEDVFQRSLISKERPVFSNPFLDESTPPPQV